MRSIVVSMQNMLLSEAVARTLAETGEFRVEQVLPGKTSDTFSLCPGHAGGYLPDGGQPSSRLHAGKSTESDRVRTQGDAELQIRAAV